MNRPLVPGVPAAGHVSSGGYWHPGKSEGCVKCPTPRTFTVTRKDIDRCPKRSLAPSHYLDDGHCRCEVPCLHCERSVRWLPASPGHGGGWTDNPSDTAILGSGELCPKRHGGHEVRGWVR